MDSGEQEFSNIVQYLNSPDDSALIKEVETWRSASGENEELFQQVSRLWALSAEAGALSKIDLDEVERRFSGKLGHITTEDNVVPITSMRRFGWIGYAAAVLLCVALYVGYTYEGGDSYITKTTYATVDSVRLSDGSAVYMGPNTSISYPEKFQGDARKIELLSGHAFFKIARDAKKPFSVKMDESDVTVLGTSFRLTKNANTIGLMVKTGKVMFTPETGNSEVLQAGDSLFYDKLHSSTSRVNANSDQDVYLSKELIFEDAPLDEVFEKIRNVYNVKVIVEGNLAKVGKFNARFSNSKLSDVLEILDQTYPIQITQKDSAIIIKRKQ